MYTVSINRLPPVNWRDLQKQVKRILEECGFKSTTDKKIRTVRGPVKVDVYASDLTTRPATVYLCECKHWRSRVPKTVVHAFRTVVADYGANWGFIISSAGFQSGASKAARRTAVRLLTWGEFQELFVDRWIDNYMMPRLRKEVDPLVEYTEPINSRIFRKASALDKDSQEHFTKLREQYGPLAFLVVLYYVPDAHPFLKGKRPDLPLRKHISKSAGLTNLPDELLDAPCLRDLVDIICRVAQEGINAFDRLFGGRA